MIARGEIIIPIEERRIVFYKYYLLNYHRSRRSNRKENLLSLSTISTILTSIRCLYKVNIWQWLDGLRSSLNLVEVTSLWGSISTLQGNLLGLSFSDSLLDCLVVSLALNDLSLASGWLQVWDSNVNLLLEDTTIVFLVDHNTNSTLVDVEDDTSAAVVVLEWHTLVDRGVDLDVNIVTSLF